MKTSSSLDRRAAQVDHQRKMKNLRDAHKNERDSVEVQHQKRLNQLESQNTVELNNAKLHHRQKYIEHAAKSEETLIKMKDSLTQVKMQTEKEMERIREAHKEKKLDTKKLQNTVYANRKDTHQMKMQDLEHESNIEIQRLQRQKDAQVKELSIKGSQAQKKLKSVNKMKMEMQKSQFQQKHGMQEGSFSRALMQQKKRHSSQLVENERNHQSKVKKRERLYKRQDDLIEKTGKAKNLQNQKRFENKFKNNFTNNEKMLQRISSKKEKILSDLKRMFKKEVKLSLDKEIDPFYKSTKLDPIVTKNENNDGYTLTINLPKHEADNVKLTASGRMLKLALDRDYSFTKKDDNGSTSKVSKVETIIQKIPVDQIVDGKSVKKSYKDEKLTFNIGLS